METINAGRQAEQQRKEFLADRYVRVRQQGDTLALRAEEGIELHHDDGTITAARPGDWVTEKADGTMGVIPAGDFVKFYEPVDDAGRDAYDATVQAVEVPESDDDGTPIPFAGEPDPYEGGVRVGADGIADHERAQGSARQDEIRAELEVQIAEMSRIGVREGVISEEEAQAWRESGEPPAGVVVSREADEWQVLREAGHDAATQTANPAALAEGDKRDPALTPDDSQPANHEVSEGVVDTSQTDGSSYGRETAGTAEPDSLSGQRAPTEEPDSADAAA